MEATTPTRAKSPDAAFADFRRADFKFFLPLGPEARALVDARGETDFTPHLAPDMAETHVLARGEAAEAWRDRVRRWETTGLSVVEEPFGSYDVVISPGPDLLDALKPGGVWLRIGPEGDDTGPTTSRWAAWPSWRSLHFLIPKTPAARRAAIWDLRVLSRRPLLNAAAHVAPGLFCHSLCRDGMALHQAPGDEAGPPFCDTLARTVACVPGAEAAASLRPEDWILYSGSLGEGNPIVAMALDASGRPWLVVKVSRLPDQPALLAEADQLAAVRERLGEELAGAMARPVGEAEVRGHSVLVYSFEPTRPFYGLLWRLWGRRRFLTGVTRWLALVARRTRRRLSPASFEARHLAPLRRGVEARAWPGDVLDDAARAVDVVGRYRDQPFSVLEHGDLGLYNFRMTERGGRAFKVIDWASADPDGVPYGDLGTLLAGSNAPVGLARRLTGAYLDGAGFPRGHGRAFWLSYMARRWEELQAVRPAAESAERPGGGGVLIDFARRVKELTG